MAFSAIWLALFAVITAMLPDPPLALVLLSLAYVAYYVAVSLWLTFEAPRRRSAAAA
jgi:phosphatidylcholine synthase